MHRPDLALLIAFVSSIFSRLGLCYDESPWQQSYDYYHIDLGELGGHHGELGIKIPVAKDVMVDVINNLGIKLLAIHNERNDNNIAISPYGALSVLAALSEGLQGDAVHEILHASNIPKDRHVIRVGLRDIHRHLKSYFIPEEGFLAGLTLNLNNVTLRREYEDVLRFYGFDYGSFNNAFYPESFTTHRPSEGSTLGTTLGLSEGTTFGSPEKIEDTTIILTETRFKGTTFETSTTVKEFTTGVSTTQGKEETTGREDTTKIDMTAATTTVPSTTTPAISTLVTEPTTLSTTTSTTTVDETTTIVPSITTRPTTITLETEPTTQRITTTVGETLTTVPSITTRPTTITLETEPTTQRTTTNMGESTTTTTIQNQETTINELLHTSGSPPEKTTEVITTKQQETTTDVPTITEEDSNISADKMSTEGVSISTKISKVTKKTSESSFEFSEISTYLLEATTASLTTENAITTDVPTTTVQEATTETVSKFTEIPVTSIKHLTTTAKPQSTTTEYTTAVPSTIDTTTTTSPDIVSTESLETTVMTQKTGDTQRTTRQISADMLPIDQLTTLSIGETTDSPQTTIVLNFNSTLAPEVSTMLRDIATETSLEITTVPSVENSDVPFVNPVVPTEGADVQIDFVNENTPTPFFDQQSEDVESTTPFFFETTPDFQDMTTFNQDNFDYSYNYDTNMQFNNNSVTANQIPSAYDDNMENLVNTNLMLDEPEGASLNRNVKRTARSVVDYVIARYYDDQHPYVAPPLQRPQFAPQAEPQIRQPQYAPPVTPPRLPPPYVPQQEPLTFAVYGKYRESGINFMKYDTVLPFFFIPNLNALALSFPLDSAKYYLLLLLPIEENGVDQLICDFRLHGSLRYIIEHLRLTHVVATIPSFTLKGYVSLTPLLQRLGIRRIFEPRQADFSPMTNVTDIYVTNIEQAVTVTIRNYLDPSAQHYKNFRQYSPVHFKADHPFLYFVIDSDLHVALMVGKVINPLNSRIRLLKKCLFQGSTE